jgi:hypothetical protein
MPSSGHGTFLLLRSIVDAFANPDCDVAKLAALVRAADTAVVPALIRELSGDDDRRRDLARVLLLHAADGGCRDRVIERLEAVVSSASPDVAKAAALGILVELGVSAQTATFSDPRDVQRRSAAQLAAHLETRADVAITADLLVHQLDGDDLIAVVEAMLDAAPDRTRRLVDELSARIDLDASIRSELRRIVAPLALGSRRASRPSPSRVGRPVVLALLVHDSGRRVVAVSRRSGRGLTWRNFAALIDDDGVLSDCLYQDDATPDALERDVVGGVVEQGFRRVAVSVAEARAVVALAARRAAASSRGLPSAYYLGRDLLGLGDSHLGDRARASALAILLGRAVDLLAAGEAARARPLLEHCARIAPDDADVASSLGLGLLATGDVAVARRWLERAARIEPDYPLHHWNAAAAAHRAGALGDCDRLLRAFLAVADRGIAGDCDHATRVEIARRFTADFARAEHLARRAAPVRVRVRRSRARAARARAPT